MEQKFSNNNIDLQVLREFCEREGEAVSYRKADQMERERLRVGELAREWAIRRASATSSCSGKRPEVERLLQRCPGIVHHLALQDLASFLCVTPNYLSTIRKDITFEAKKSATFFK